MHAIVMPLAMPAGGVRVAVSAHVVHCGFDLVWLVEVLDDADGFVESTLRLATAETQPSDACDDHFDLRFIGDEGPHCAMAPNSFKASGTDQG